MLELNSSNTFDSSEECVAAGKAKTSPFLSCCVYPLVKKHSSQSAQLQFSSCIKSVLGRHFHKILADLKSRLELGFKKARKCKPSSLERRFFQIWGLVFFVTPPLPEGAFLILLSLPISCRCHSLRDLIFIVKLTSSQVYSDQVVIETNGRVMGGCQTVCSDILAISS